MPQCSSCRGQRDTWNKERLWPLPTSSSCCSAEGRPCCTAWRFNVSCCCYSSAAWSHREDVSASGVLVGEEWGSLLDIVGHCCVMAWASLPFFIRAFLITSHPQGYDECSGKVRRRRERSVLVRPIAVVEGIHRGQGKIWKICARLRSCGTWMLCSERPDLIYHSIVSILLQMTQPRGGCLAWL